MTHEHLARVAALGEEIDRLCTLDLRPSGPIGGYIGRFYAAARQQCDTALTFAAARCLNSVAPGDTVVIATGFCDPPRLPQGETDGPPGAAVLARAVLLGLQATPVLVGEAAIAEPLQACTRSLGLRLHPDLAVARQVPYGVGFYPFPLAPQEAQAAACTLLEQTRPAVVVVTERAGPNRLGVAHSAMGRALPAGSRALVEYLLEAAHAAGIPTIGVGDNGNDMGFGCIEDVVRRHKPYGDVCQCPCGGGLATVVKTSLLVTAAVANWGVYGVVACLAALRQQPALLHSAAEEADMLQACVGAGAADGITGRPLPTVDGLPTAVQCSIVELLHALVAKVC
ncbi:MAG: hypothetical protein KatS3mg131_0754 [Candidatus Tectimicrobiota bacterium]|nr:MAG: hypothetical protein KatS3mg131_0754 [Candidatus Tectomicrobia bacterium]